MKNTKRILSVILCLLMILTALPLTLISAGAQECSWDYIIGGTKYTLSQLNSNAVKGLSIEGNYLVLNNYTGKQIAAIPGGTYGDDDAPVLRIKLIGTNTLSGMELKDISNNEVALYSEKRAGGTGNPSKIEISGKGATLNINVSVSNKSTSLYGIYADELNVLSGTVNVNVVGRGIKDENAEAVGIYADVTLTGSGILNVNAEANTYRRHTTEGTVTLPVFSKCKTYGIKGNASVKTECGYLSVDTSGNNSTGESYCVNGKVSFDDATNWLHSALYFISNSDNLVKGGCTADDKGLEFIKRTFKNTDTENKTTLNYEAYGPVSAQVLSENTALSCVYMSDLASLLKFPAIGEDKVFETNSEKYAEQHVYARQQTYKCYYDGQAYQNTYWDTMELTQNGDYYDFTLYFYPMPGYWCNVGAGNYTEKSFLTAFDYEPNAALSFISDTHMSAGYKYSAVSIKTQPQDVNYDSTDISVVASGDNDLTYEWFLEVYKNADDATPAATISMTEFDEMGYGFTGQDESTMCLGELQYDETVKGCDFKYIDAASFKLFCKVSTMGYSTNTDKVTYEPFKSIKITAQPENATLNEAGSAKFTVKATGEGLTYKWYYNGGELVNAENRAVFYGAKTDTLIITVKSSMGEAIYTSGKKFTCKITDAYGRTVETNGVTLSKAHTHSYTGAVKSNGDGTHSFKCTGCDTYGNTANCTWDKGTVTKAATATEEGIMTYTCTVCKGTKTEKIEKLKTETFTLGDIDNDGKITAADARLALRASVGLTGDKDNDGKALNFKDTTNREFKAADVDPDTKITAADARLILRASVGLETLGKK